MSHWCGLEKQPVYVAPGPVLPRLKASYHGMVRRMEVLGGVLAGRAVAAPYVATAQAEPQVNPTAPRLETLLAPLRRVWLYWTNLRNV